MPRTYTAVPFEQKWKTDPVTGCWLWQGSIFKRGGYGRHWHEGHQRRAHRVSWLLHRGPILDGLHVLHSCDTPSCVNPEHLFLGTNTDNVNDKMAKGRESKGEKHRVAVLANVARGERASGAKLKLHQVEEIRRLRAEGRGVRELGRLYGMSHGAVGELLRGQSWKDVRTSP